MYGLPVGEVEMEDVFDWGRSEVVVVGRVKLVTEVRIGSLVAVVRVDSADDGVGSSSELVG